LLQTFIGMLRLELSLAALPPDGPLTPEADVAPGLFSMRFTAGLLLLSLGGGCEYTTAYDKEGASINSGITTTKSRVEIIS